MLEKIVSLALILVAVGGGLLLIIDNLNTRFEGFRPTGIAPFPPTGVVGILCFLAIILAAVVYYSKGREG